jgi:hypothetical protein
MFGFGNKKKKKKNGFAGKGVVSRKEDVCMSCTKGSAMWGERDGCDRLGGGGRSPRGVGHVFWALREHVVRRS